MLIRDAKSEDAYRIAVIRIDSWRAAYRGIMPDAVLDGLSINEQHKFWLQQLSGSGRQTIVVEDHSQIVGWAGFGPCRDAAAAALPEVYGIYLDPSHYRRGFGRLLWKENCRRLTTQGYEQVLVWVLEANAPARRFYEAMGGCLDEGVEKVLTREGVRLPELRYRCPCR
jgi:L-amino acid N-acyltransferase YncA